MAPDRQIGLRAGRPEWVNGSGRIITCRGPNTNSSETAPDGLGGGG